MANPNVTYGYARFGEVADNANALMFSGVVMNVGFPTQSFTLTIAFDGGGSFTSSPFSLPEGSSAAFSYLIDIPFAGAHSGTLTLSGSPGSSESSSFTSDPSTGSLGFQLTIFGHAMPVPPPGTLPSVYFSLVTV